jgi:nicotinamide riboside kinase
MTLILNFLGQPSSGKTSLSVKLFAKLKELNLNVEYSPEVVKTWCYTGQKVTKYDQYYLFGSEIYQQSRLFNAVDIIISDSSPILAAFYNYYYNSGDSSLSPACKEFYRKVAEDNIKVMNFFLPRKKKYVAKGRYQTEEQANEVAVDLRNWLDSEGYKYEVLDCPDKERVDMVLKKLEEVTGGFDGMSMV